MTIGEKLQFLRKNENLSQEILAEKLNVSRQAISKWEVNTALPEVDNIVLISKFFNITTDELLNDEKELKPKVEHPKPQKVIENWLKSNRCILYIAYIFIVFLVFLSVATLSVSTGGAIVFDLSNLENINDIPSLIFTFTPLILTLTATGKIKYFIKTVALAFSNTPIAKIEEATRKNCIDSLNITFVTLVLTSVINCTLGFIGSVNGIVEMIQLIVMIAILSIGWLYAALFTLLLLPIYFIIKDEI